MLEEEGKEAKHKKQQEEFKERNARKKFQELIQKLVEDKTITYRKKWKDVVPIIQAESSFLDMMANPKNSSRPHEIFFHKIRELKEEHKQKKEMFYKWMKEMKK